MRLRRTIYWANGLALDALKAAIESNTDCICLDLEDGIMNKLKDECRAATVDVLKNLDFRGKERIVRINKFGTEHFQPDLDAILPCRPDALRIPKAERVEDLLALDETLAKFEVENGMAKDSIELILLIETPLGMLRCYELASCCERITAVGIGMEDFTAAMGLQRYYELNTTDLLYARQKMVMDCRAAGVQALDSGTLFKGNVEFMRKDSAIDRRHGFNGRSVGDLCQVDAINEVFSPSEQDVSWANRVIAAYSEGMEAGDNGVYVDGCFVDPPVVDKAERILAEMRAIEKRSSR